MGGVRQQHEVAACYGEVGGQAGAFGSDGLFHDLDEDILVGLQQLCDIFLHLLFFAHAFDIVIEIEVHVEELFELLRIFQDV